MLKNFARFINLLAKGFWVGDEATDIISREFQEHTGDSGGDINVWFRFVNLVVELRTKMLTFFIGKRTRRCRHSCW